MTNLRAIENKLNKLCGNNINILSYNFDSVEYDAEKLLLSGLEISAKDIADKIAHIIACNKANGDLYSFPKFLKLTSEEQKYYAAVDCARGKAIKGVK